MIVFRTIAPWDAVKIAVTIGGPTQTFWPGFFGPHGLRSVWDVWQAFAAWVMDPARAWSGLGVTVTVEFVGRDDTSSPGAGAGGALFRVTCSEPWSLFLYTSARDLLGIDASTVTDNQLTTNRGAPGTWVRPPDGDLWLSDRQPALDAGTASGSGVVQSGSSGTATARVHVGLTVHASDARLLAKLLTGIHAQRGVWVRDASDANAVRLWTLGVCTVAASQWPGLHVFTADLVRREP